ncbi:MAG: formylglycine-generating enzyme family protein [Spirochaetales bacterium]
MKLKKKKELPAVEPVKIKPLFGMKPGLRLTIVYALAFLLAVFLIAFLPDILDGSKRVTFTSAADNAAVYVDGLYKGGTPFTTKIPSGTHNVSYQVNGCEIDNFTFKVGHPVFLNWLFPRTQKVESSAPLTQEAFRALSAELLEDANAYSSVLTYDSVHIYPELFTHYAKAVSSSAFARDTDVLQAAMLFVTTPEMYEDAKNAMDILGISLDIPYSLLSIEKTVGTADREIPKVTAKSAPLETDFFTLEGFNIPAASFSNGKTVQASYADVLQAGKNVQTQAFNIGAYCVTEYQFAQFVSAVPEWSPENRENLIVQGLVDSYYLDGVNLSLSGSTNKPVRNVSWYAASAFCLWLSEVSGKTVYLPTENQWIAASLSDSENGFQKSLMPSVAENSPAAMLGSVWEMTRTPFVPLSRLSSIDISNILSEYDTQVDMVIKGGSFVSDSKTVDRYSVGICYRSLCSDFMGFRVAWEEV